MRFFASIIVMLFATGCGLTSQGDVLRNTVREKAKAVAAQSLENSEWYMCRASPVGAIKDRYSASGALSWAYNTICERYEKPTPVLPNGVSDKIAKRPLS